MCCVLLIHHEKSQGRPPRLHDVQDHYLELFIDLLRAGAEARAKARRIRSLDRIQVDVQNANVDVAICIKYLATS